MTANGIPIYVEIDENSKCMWWLMDDLETVRLFKPAPGDRWDEILPENWKMSEIEHASILPDIYKEVSLEE